MTHKNKLYAAGTAICVVAIGAVVFYLIKINSGSNRECKINHGRNSAGTFG